MKKKIKLLALLGVAAMMFGCSNEVSSSTDPSSGGSSVTPSSNTGNSSTGGDSTGTSDSSHDIETIEPSTVSPTGTETGNRDANGKFYSDYGSKADTAKAGKDLAIDIASEGDTLLKNANNALPLSSYEKKVTVFGMASVDLVTAGGGSGAGTTGNNDIAYTGLVESLEDAGLEVNPVTVNLYKTYHTLGTINNELPVENYTPSTIASYYGYNDVAIVTLSRIGTENKDLQTCEVEDHANADDHILQMDDNEKAMIKHVKQYFDKVVVIINSSNIMQIPELDAEKTSDNYGVDAILWVGGVGNNGAMAIGRILKGTVNPSGHTSDLWARDFTKDPTFTNFGWQTQNKDSSGNRMNAFFYDKDGKMTNYADLEYREGIYSGYKYYETLATDKGNDGEQWYKENVLYPFGYGLSYTTFSWEWDSITKGDITAGNQEITCKVKVTNTGEVAGKDVVQIYYSAPYTKGGIEKASNNLINFGKTKLLNPGESDVVTVKFTAQDMASFDYNDKNNNNFKGYELEKGDYVITANKDSHTPVLTHTKKVASDLQLETDYITGKEIKPLFSDEDDQYLSTSESLLNNSISRATGLKQPEPASLTDRTLTDAQIALLDDQDVYNHYELQESDPWYVSSTPSTWNQGETHNLKLADMAGIDYEDLTIADDGSIVEGTDDGSKKWTEFMNELSWDDMANIVSGDNHSGPGMGAIEAIGMDENNYADGPVQIRGGTLFPSAPILAASFNVTLGQKMGRMVGNDAIWNNLSQWAGPAMNTHRSPFSGRNFEYYSQDGWHAARFAAAAVTGAASKGLISYVKHFFLNDQESYRADYGGVCTFVTEQAMREGYLKPFEWAFKVGKSLGAMSSFNRIGFAVTAESYAVHQYLLRDEWDSKADVCTDAWAKDYVPVNLMAYAGSDQLLGNSSTYAKNSFDRGTWDSTAKMVKTKGSKDSATDDTNNPSLYFGIRRKAQRALYTRANSTTVKNGISSGATFSVDAEVGVPNAVSIASGDIGFTIDDTAEASLKEYGLSLVNGKVISGTATKEGSVTIQASVNQDNWISSTANITVNVKSAIHVNDIAMTTGTSAATFTADSPMSMKVDIPALAYFNEIAGAAQFWGRSMNGLIVNAYQDSTDDSWHQRDEDKTASDIITIDASTAKDSKIYDYKFSNVPAGLTANAHKKEVMGKANKSKYEVVDYYTLDGTLSAGKYTVDVDLEYYTNAYMSGWIFSGTPTEHHYTGTITFTVA